MVHVFPSDTLSGDLGQHLIIKYTGKKMFFHRFVFDSPQGTEKIKFYILACHVNPFKTFGQNVMYILIYV